MNAPSELIIATQMLSVRMQLEVFYVNATWDTWEMVSVVHVRMFATLCCLS